MQRRAAYLQVIKRLTRLFECRRPAAFPLPCSFCRCWSFIISSAMRILRIRGARRGSRRQGACWPLVTNYQVIIAARPMSEVSAISPVNALLLKARETFKCTCAANSERLLPLKTLLFFLSLSLCLLRSASRGSAPVHGVFTGPQVVPDARP